MPKSRKGGFYKYHVLVSDSSDLWKRKPCNPAIYIHLLFGAFIWFHRKMQIFHGLFNQCHSVRTIGLRINTFVGHSCCYISKHRFQLGMSLLFRNLKFTFFQYLQKILVISKFNVQSCPRQFFFLKLYDVTKRISFNYIFQLNCTLCATTLGC